MCKCFNNIVGNIIIFAFRFKYLDLLLNKTGREEKWEGG